MSNDTILDLDSLLDSNLGSVEDVPDFVNPPAGTYVLKVNEAKTETYTSKAKPAQGGQPARAESKGLRLKIVYEIVETIETKELPVANGSLFSESFMASEDGLKFFKKQARNILNVKDIGATTIRDILDALGDTEFKAAITIRSTPNPAGGTYENTSVRPVHEVPAE